MDEIKFKKNTKIGNVVIACAVIAASLTFKLYQEHKKVEHLEKEVSQQTVVIGELLGGK